MRSFLLAVVLGVSLLVLSGCATTRAGQFGWLANREPLVTLIVTEDLDLVLRYCMGLAEHGVVVGCQRSRLVGVADNRTVRAVKVVRYTDALPSLFAFQIAGHELCHAVADVQSIPDPCHDDNDGVIPAAMPGSLVQRFLRGQ